MKVLATAEVIEYLNNLITILFEKEYFSYEENAIRYVKELFDEIEKDLPNRSKKPAPKHFDKYGTGMYYAVFKKNKRTSWYAFFRIYRKDGEIYFQVRHVENNHTAAHFL
ncbi:MAG: hypothetical protein LBE82_04270 [Chitinophagaceae bacterium]|jgi:DNA polymerase III delta prime subunit|nr:hypothetical protein [Chitinophagaceae bacterium]